MRKTVNILLSMLMLTIVSCTVSYKFNQSSIDYNIVKTIQIAEFRPRSWRVYCPMGTLTQLVCKRKASSEEKMQEGDFAK